MHTNDLDTELGARLTAALEDEAANIAPPIGAWDRLQTRLAQESADAGPVGAVREIHGPADSAPPGSRRPRSGSADHPNGARTRWYIPVIAAASVVLLALGVTAAATGMFRTEDPGQAAANPDETTVGGFQPVPVSCGWRDHTTSDSNLPEVEEIDCDPAELTMRLGDHSEVDDPLYSFDWEWAAYGGQELSGSTVGGGHSPLSGVALDTDGPDGAVLLGVLPDAVASLNIATHPQPGFSRAVWTFAGSDPDATDRGRSPWVDLGAGFHAFAAALPADTVTLTVTALAADGSVLQERNLQVDGHIVHDDAPAPDPTDPADPDSVVSPEVPDPPAARDPEPANYPLCPDAALTDEPAKLGGVGAAGAGIAFYPSSGVCFFDGRSWWTARGLSAYSVAAEVTDVINDLHTPEGTAPAEGRFVYGVAFGDQQVAATVDGKTYSSIMAAEHTGMHDDGHPNFNQFAIPIPPTGDVLVTARDSNGHGPEDITLTDVTAGDGPSANDPNGPLLTTFDPQSAGAAPPSLVAGTITSYNGCVALVLDEGTPGARVVTPVFADGEVGPSSYPTLLTYDGVSYADGDRLSVVASTEPLGGVPERCSSETVRVAPANSGTGDSGALDAVNPSTWTTDDEGSLILTDNLLYHVSGGSWGGTEPGASDTPLDVVTIMLGPDEGDLGYEIGYVPEIVQDGSGLPAPLTGSAALQVRIGASAVQPVTGDPTLDLSHRDNLVGTTQYAAIQQVAFVSSFEGQTVLGIGVDGQRPFHAETSVNSWGDRVLTIWVLAD